MTAAAEADTASGTTSDASAADSGNAGEQQAAEAQGAQGAQGQSAEGAKTEGEQDKPQGAPEKYEFKAADGATFDDAVIGAFSDVSRELNLTQDAAQKMLDKMAPVMQARQAEQFEAARNQWSESAKTDKEFGGDKLTENLATAKKALDTFGTPEFRSLLDQSGLGNHPEVIRVFYRAGKAISEDKFVTGGVGQSGSTSVAARMYPNMNP